MLKYDYRLNQSDPSNPYINELGLDDYSYYMHPADKHNRDRINRNLFGDESDIEPEDYDMFYKEEGIPHKFTEIKDRKKEEFLLTERNAEDIIHLLELAEK